MLRERVKGESWSASLPCEGVCGTLPDLHYKGRKSPEESEGQIFSPIYFHLPFVLLIFAVHFEPIPLRVIHQRPQGTG